MMLVIVIVMVFGVLITRVMKMVVVIVGIVGSGSEENKFYKFPLNSFKYLF